MDEAPELETLATDVLGPDPDIERELVGLLQVPYADPDPVSRSVPSRGGAVL